MRKTGTALIPVLRIFGEQLHDEAGQRPGNVRVEIARRLGHDREVAMYEFGLVLDLERQSPRQHLVERDAKRIEIGASVDAAIHATGLFRRDVVQRALQIFRCPARGRLARACRRDPEISELHGERLWIDQNVGRFHVLVDDVARMDSPERLGGLTRNHEKGAERQRPALEVARKRDTAAVGKDEDIMATGSLQRDRSRNADVVEGARQRELAFQPNARLRPGMRRIGNFDNDGGPVVETRCTVYGEMSPRMQRFTYSETGQFNHFDTRMGCQISMLG